MADIEVNGRRLKLLNRRDRSRAFVTPVVVCVPMIYYMIPAENGITVTCCCACYGLLFHKVGYYGDFLTVTAEWVEKAECEVPVFPFISGLEHSVCFTSLDSFSQQICYAAFIL